MGSIRMDETGLRDLKLIPTEDGKCLEFQGWTFRANLEPITKDADFDAYRERIGGARNLPEQLFGDNLIEIRHWNTGFVLRLDAFGGLKQWHIDNLAPLQLENAQQWRKSRAASFEQHEIANVTYDWTYTTTYAGTYERANGPGATPVGESGWNEVEGTMDKSLLLRREPILFFAEVPLYESELDDNGTAQLNVKIRVMPSCWYVLQRFFLRVDKHLVRVRDVRILCDLTKDRPAIIREVSRMEGTFEELTAAGSSKNPAAFRNPDTAAEFFQAIAPVGHDFLKTAELSYERWAGTR